MTDELSRIRHSADTLSEVDFADQPKRHATEAGEKAHSQFEAILRFAHANYDKKKISFRPNEDGEGRKRKQRKHGAKKGYQGQRKVRPKPMQVVQVPLGEVCPKCKSEPLRPTKRTSKRLIIDLVLAENGIRKTITEYMGIQGYCSECHRSYAPPGIRRYGANQLYGHGFKAWFVYQRVALRLPYGKIAEAMEEQFNETVSAKSNPAFIRHFAYYYAETERFITQNLLESPFIHVDETSISIRGISQYVWVVTDGKYVVFKLTETREATFIHEFLNDYDGILITDFYSGYDSIGCRQQKCWVHLIRDLNNDLWEAPFDAEFETFVLEVRNLIVPIIEAVYNYGLKRQHLCRFKPAVERFYKEAITDKRYKSELVLKYRKRFVRYRESLFTFLEQDGITWHNNTAERALRHIVKQQQVSGSFHESMVPHYLVLLGIRQTCRFQRKSFFKFLFSGERDIDAFENAKPT